MTVFHPLSHPIVRLYPQPMVDCPSGGVIDHGAGQPSKVDPAASIQHQHEKSRITPHKQSRNSTSLHSASPWGWHDNPSLSGTPLPSSCALAVTRQIAVRTPAPKSHVKVPAPIRRIADVSLIPRSWSSVSLTHTKQPAESGAANQGRRRSHIAAPGRDGWTCCIWRAQAGARRARSNQLPSASWMLAL